MTSTSSSWVVVGSGAALALLGNGNSCSQLHQLGCCSARLDDQLSEEGCFEMMLPPVKKKLDQFAQTIITAEISTPEKMPSFQAVSGHTANT